MSWNLECSFRADVLKEFWLFFKDDDDEYIQEFIQVNDLGLPLAYFVSEGFISDEDMNDKVETMINDTWNSMLNALDLTTDEVEGMTFSEILDYLQEA